MSGHTVGAAFRSSTSRQCYMFVKDQYAVIDYCPGYPKSRVISGSGDITDGFPSLAGTIFKNGIDCAFDIENHEAYIFLGNQCAKIRYTPRSEARILTGPKPIGVMFDCLAGTRFEDGINAAIRYDKGDSSVLFFKGDHTVLVDYSLNSREGTEKIIRRFNCLYGTVFESGIDAAFTSHVYRQFYIFKGERCARIEYSDYNNSVIFGGRIKRISDEWPALHDMFEE